MAKKIAARSLKPKQNVKETARQAKTKPVRARQRAAAAPAAPKAADETRGNKDRFFAGVGRRKTAVARIRLFTKGDKLFSINGKSLNDYFGNNTTFITTAAAALDRMRVGDKFRVEVKVSGGGRHAQAEAIRHGIARSLVLFNPDFRKRLKRAGFLTRDPRMVERKKYGLKKARRAPQWQKR